MKFSEFQATGRDVPDVRIVPAIADSCGADEPMPGRLYFNDELYIETDVFTDGTTRYWVTIGNGGTAASTHLAEHERELYDYAITEGYIDAPTTEEELVDALQGLLNYVGGWDTPAGHPCRVAADLLARVGDEAPIPTRCDRNCQCPECRKAREGEVQS